MEVLRAAAERYDSLRALCADFRQVRRVPLLHQVTESAGRLCHQDPDLFLMDFSDPEGDIVVGDGRYLWIYYPSMDPQQVFRQPLEQGPEGRFDFHREFLGDPGSKYAPEYLKSDSLGGHATDVLRLVPRGPSAYREAEVWIDSRSRLLRKVVIVEENESVREVTLSRLQVNPELRPEVFRFVPPEGVTIVRR